MARAPPRALIFATGSFASRSEWPLTSPRTLITLRDEEYTSPCLHYTSRDEGLSAAEACLTASDGV